MHRKTHKEMADDHTESMAILRFGEEVKVNNESGAGVQPGRQSGALGLIPALHCQVVHPTWCSQENLRLHGVQGQSEPHVTTFSTKQPIRESHY